MSASSLTGAALSGSVALPLILAAHKLVARHLRLTPLLPSHGLSRRTQANIHLKPECWQLTGSFKVRGALNRLAALAPHEQAVGVVTASAGNHGLGVAYAAQILGLPAPTIFVPETVAAAKAGRLADLPCRVVKAGADYDAAEILAREHAAEHGAIYVSAYDDPLVIAGQGTVALEILAELPEAELLLVPVGGGGLIAGTAIVAKAVNPAIRVVGVQPHASPAALLSLQDGRPYEAFAAGPTICDGLAGGFGRLPFELAAHLIDEILLVPEEAIRRAVGWLLAHEQLAVEGSAAIAVAPLLTGALDVRGASAVAVLTGRNIDPTLLRQILNEGEAEAP